MNRKYLASVILPCSLVLTALVGPTLVEPFELVRLSSFATLAIAVLGLAFVWGVLGVLSLGHTAFFGLGAYAYALAAPNLGDSTPALVLAVIIPVAFSLALGYFLFYSRLADVYLGVITLCVSLIFFSFTTSTADPSYRIGDVPIGGFNGISAVLPLNSPGAPDEYLSIEATFRVCLLVLAILYALLAIARASNLGRIMAGIRESELRSELLGYDIRFYKLLGFAIGAAVGGLGGGLFAAVGGYVGPTVFNLAQASQFLLWVIAGGLGTLAGPLMASFGFQFLGNWLGANQILNTDLVFGATTLPFVLLAPDGLLPMLRRGMPTLSRIRIPRLRFRENTP